MGKPHNTTGRIMSGLVQDMIEEIAKQDAAAIEALDAAADNPANTFAALMTLLKSLRETHRAMRSITQSQVDICEGRSRP